MPYLDKQKQRDYNRNWARTHRRSRIEYSRELRKKVLGLFGGKCIYCGCDILEALEINHKNGGGSKEYKEGTRRGGNAYLKEFLDGIRNKEDYELTCRICNAWHYITKIKRIEDRWKITFV